MDFVVKNEVGKKMKLSSNFLNVVFNFYTVLNVPSFPH